MTVDQNTPEQQGGSHHVSSAGDNKNNKNQVSSGKAAATWVGVIVTALLLIALIVFIAQNQRHVTTRFLGLDGSTSLGLTVLVAAVVGALLTAIPGTIRILQLRHAVKKNHR